MIVFVFLQERAFFSHRYASENRFVPPFFGFLRVIALKTPGRSTFSHSSRKLTAVEHPAAIDVYTVENSGGETFLFPAVPEFLDTLSPEQGVVTVRPIPGMFTNDGGNDDAD